MSDNSGKVSNKRRLGFGKACFTCRKKKHRCDGRRPNCFGGENRGLRCEYADDVAQPLLGGIDNVARAPRRRGDPRGRTRDLLPATEETEGFLGGAVGQRSRNIDGSGESVQVPSPEEVAGACIKRDIFVSSTASLVESNGYLGDSSTLGFVSKIRPELQPTTDGTHSIVMTQTSRNRKNPSWLALVNLVFAYGCEFCLAGDIDEFDKHYSTFIERAKRIILSLVFRSADLALVQALLLLCRYMQGTLALNACWNFSGLMIRNAISIGLHVDPTDDGTILPVERESRKRLWWGCLVLDRTLCMKLGRPPSIRETDAHGVDLPLEVDDQYIIDTSLVPRQPLGRPSRMSFFVQTIKLSHIIDCILSRIYPTNAKGEKKRYQTSLSHRTDESSILGNTFLLDGQLQAWWNEMPLYLREDPNMPDGIDFQRQRRVMRIRFLQIRLLLQRPIFLLFSQGQIQDEFMRAGAVASSQVCIFAAQETIQLIHQDYNRQFLNSVWYNLHYVFTSLAVLMTVQTMEKSLRSLLSSLPERAVFDRGMEFLRAVSTLASHYVTILDRLRTPPSGPNENTQTIPSRNPTEPLTEQACAPQTDPSLFGFRDDIDFPVVDSLNSLFETGLPLSTTDWACFNGSL
ncbi:uncharacterized protein Z518_11159 [Rhinocladiella mackenziei CBS 650.93]|uniref:Zn(2)-C6 fungal-type domain-containing protein n=1 Tax=Rhinocladiella mackenziei CBS 650.93 TaxID=1442369 RepID=A0A0D2FCB4_9EURO|nr:uncharacterized protein Z518_11159 [Rhinocladiella mackenziei CBS 650.93]KIW99746.1 hypothetical protein Z518_11159 [Rhinocladiella mackenziei CBS 650.93]